MDEMDYIQQDASTRYSSFIGANYSSTPGSNGLVGFKKWECYMLLKYGNSSYGTSNDYEYLIELPMYPDQVTESISAQWETQSSLGRSSPISAYAETGLKSVQFSIDLHRDFLTGSFSHTEDTASRYGYEKGAKVSKAQLAGYQDQGPDGPFETRTWYLSMNKMLQMSCYPQYTKQGLIPPTTYFIFGQMILKGYVTSYSTEWKKPIINTFYGWNSVSINMQCYPDKLISARDMILNSSSSSTQNTYNTPFPNPKVERSNVMQRSEMKTRNNYRNNSLGGNVMDIR